jgi:hypothetical protein
LIRRARSYERLVALGLEIRVARAAGGFQVQLEVLWLLSSTVAAAQATQPEATRLRLAAAEPSSSLKLVVTPAARSLARFDSTGRINAWRPARGSTPAMHSGPKRPRVRLLRLRVLGAAGATFWRDPGLLVSRRCTKTSLCPLEAALRIEGRGEDRSGWRRLHLLIDWIPSRTLLLGDASFLSCECFVRTFERESPPKDSRSTTSQSAFGMSKR